MFAIPRSSLSRALRTTVLWSAVAANMLLIAGTHVCGHNDGGQAPPQVGSVAGALQVSDSGAATYTVPLRLPVGVGAAVPSLALTYSSQAGDGLLGMGWSLAGLSTIARCPRDNFIDGEIHGIDYSADDAFCLDGARLIEVGPGEYRTEVEQFARIESFGTAGTGPARFVVTAPNGVQHEYGGTPDSQIEAVGLPTPQPLRVYAINRVTDPSGNYYTVTYEEDGSGGGFRPTQLDYTAHDNVDGVPQGPKNRVVFGYEARPTGDAALVPRYLGPTPVNTTDRMTAVLISSKDELGAYVTEVEYRLSYETALTERGRSRLSSIEECGPAATFTVCKPATTFHWADGTAGLDGITDPQGNLSTNPDDYMETLAVEDWSQHTPYSGDYDGDGITDLFLVKDGDLRFCSGRDIKDEVPCGGAQDGRQWQTYHKIYPGDYDGDGRTDFFLSTVTANPTHWFVSDLSELPNTTDIALTPSWNHEPIYAGDYDGDGRTDLLRVIDGSQKFCPGYAVSTGNGSACVQAGTLPWGSAYDLYPGDYTGDGRTDVVAVTDGSVMFCDGSDVSAGSLSNCVTLATTENWKSDYEVHPGDFNGDGQEDLYLVSDTEAKFCPGPGISLGDNCVDTSPTDGLKSDFTMYFGDFNGDGSTDIGRVDDAGIDFCPGPYITKSDGLDDYCFRIIEEEGLQTAAVQVIPGDFDGDGVPDFLIETPACPAVPFLQLPVFNFDGTNPISGNDWHPDIGRDSRAGHPGYWRVSQGGSSGKAYFSGLSTTILSQEFFLTVDQNNTSSLELREDGGPEVYTFTFPGPGGPYPSGPRYTTANNFELETNSSPSTVDVGEFYRVVTTRNPPTGIEQTATAAWGDTPISGLHDYVRDGAFGSPGPNDLVADDHGASTFVQFATPSGTFEFQRIHVWIDADNSGPSATIRIKVHGAGVWDVWGSDDVGENAGEITADYYSGSSVQLTFDTYRNGNQIEIRNDDQFGNHLRIKEIQREVFVETEGVCAQNPTGALRLARGRRGPIDVIDSIHVGLQSDGTGNDYTITYNPLTNTHEALYTKGTGATFPTRDVQNATWVVQKLTLPDGSGALGAEGSYAVSYEYEGLRADTECRESFGFDAVEVLDHRNDILTRREFEQAPYLRGRANFAAAYDFADSTFNHPLSETTTTWTLLSSDKTCAGCVNGPMHPVSEVTVERSFELNDQPTTTRTTTVSNFTTFGRPQDIAVVVDNEVTSDLGEYQTTTHIQYQDDTTLWILGQPTLTTVNAAGPAGASPARVTSMHYDALGRVDQTIAYVGSPTAQRTTTVDDYSDRGLNEQTTQSVTDPGSPDRVVVTRYNDRGLPYEVEGVVPGAVNHITKVTFDAFGRLTASEDLNGVLSSSAYDAFGRQTQATRQGSPTVDTLYFDCSAGCPFSEARLLRETKVQGASPSLAYFDALGRNVGAKRTDPAGRTVYSYARYDALGRAAARSRPYFDGDTPQETTASYDLFNRPTSTITPGLGDREFHTDYASLQVTQRTPDVGEGEQVTIQRLDAGGNLFEVTDAHAKTTQYTRDGFGLVRTIVDSQSNAIVYGYDVAGRKTSVIDPSLGQWTYEYSGFGQSIRAESLESGRLIQTTYDAVGRRATRTDSMPAESETWTWTYDTAPNGIGMLDSVQNGSGSYQRSHTYDSFSRPDTTTVTSDAPAASGLGSQSGSVSVTYDATGRPSTTSYPGLTTTIGYGSDASVVQIKEGTSVLWEALDWDAQGRVTTSAYLNGVSSTRTYDPVTDDLDSIVTAGGSVQDLVYTSDALGNVRTRRDQTDLRMLDETFGYDRLNRLTWAEIGSEGKLYNGYDELGNPSCMRSTDPTNCFGGNGLELLFDGTAGPHGVTAALQLPGANELNVDGKPGVFAGAYQYDADGNQVLRTGFAGANPREIDYGVFSKPTEILLNAITQTEYVYGPNQGLVWRHHHVGPSAGTVFMPFSGYEEWTNGSTEHRITIPTPDGNKLVYKTLSTTAPFDGTKMEYVHTDHLGSSSVVTDDTGLVVEEHAFDPFGRHRHPDTGALIAPSAVSTRTTDMSFTGQREEPDHNLYNYGARFYDPTVGRFLQPDPVLQAPDDMQNLNRYTYVFNNPLSLVDPSGNVTRTATSRTRLRGRNGSFWVNPGDTYDHSIGAYGVAWSRPISTSGGCGSNGYQGLCSYTITTIGSSQSRPRSAIAPQRVVETSSIENLSLGQLGMLSQSASPQVFNFLNASRDQQMATVLAYLVGGTIAVGVETAPGISDLKGVYDWWQERTWFNGIGAGVGFLPGGDLFRVFSRRVVELKRLLDLTRDRGIVDVVARFDDGMFQEVALLETGLVYKRPWPDVPARDVQLTNEAQNFVHLNGGAISDLIAPVAIGPGGTSFQVLEQGLTSGEVRAQLGAMVGNTVVDLNARNLARIVQDVLAQDPRFSRVRADDNMWNMRWKIENRRLEMTGCFDSTCIIPSW